MSFTLWWKTPVLGTDLSCSPGRPAPGGTLLETKRHCFPDIILQLKSEASNLWSIGRPESTIVLISVTRTPSWCVHREDRAPDAPRSWYGSSSPLRQTRGDQGPSKGPGANSASEGRSKRLGPPRNAVQKRSCFGIHRDVPFLSCQPQFESKGRSQLAFRSEERRVGKEC